MDSKALIKKIGNLKKENRTYPKKWPFIAAVVLGLICFLIVAIVGLIAEPNSAGEYGDYVGGISNPLLAFFAFVALLYTIYIQQSELRLSRENLELTKDELAKSSSALARQADLVAQSSFESTFFALVEILDELKSQLYHEDMYIGAGVTTHRSEGVEAFVAFRKYLHTAFKKEKGNGSRQTTTINYVLKAWEVLWKKNSEQLAPYFRTMFNIMRFIDEYPGEKEIHVRILRARLTDSELIVLLYNCLSHRGLKMKEYAEKLSLFDNLDRSYLFEKGHVANFDPKAFG